MRLSSKACFDPHAAADVHTRLSAHEKASGRLNVNFLYTHPTSSKRAKLFNEMLPEAYEILAANPACAKTRENFDAFQDAAGVSVDRYGGTATAPTEERWRWD